LYSGELGFFTSELIRLLDEMAMDISFAMDRIDAERERLCLTAELAALNARTQGVIEGTQDLVMAVDKDLRLVLCNHAHKQLLEHVLGGELAPNVCVGDWSASGSHEARLFADHLEDALAGEKQVLEWNSLREGREIFFESYFAPLLDANGALIGAFHVGKNVSQHRKMSLELKKLTTAVEQSPVTVMITDLDAKIEYVNPAFTAISGYTADEVMGKTPRILQGGKTRAEEYQAMWQNISNGIPWFGILHNKRKDGTPFWEEAVIAPVRDAHGAITQYVAMKQDITMRLEAEEQVKFLSSHDPLTCLPNRVLGKIRMEQAMREADRSGLKSALLFIDVDNFKRVNESLGYRVGDLLLQAIAKRIQCCLRATDTLSRTGGDEFLVALAAVEQPEMIEQIANEILEAVSAAVFEIEGFELTATLSIGVASYPDDSREFERLQKQADMAMSFAKKSGRNMHRFYTQRMENEANEYLMMLNGLRRALDRREFVLHYQPQLSLCSGALVGAEALIRWNHPELGMVQPGRFIPVAEDSGLIVEIGQWVLDEACRQAARWQAMGFGRMVIAVNLSAAQFKRAGLVEKVSKALDDTGLDPCCLKLELTESILIENEARVRLILTELKALGVGLALDDFGTGYASFAYLRNFNLDELKIDQSFIREISTNKGDERIVKSIVELARGFGLHTVAEGIEDSMALELVRAAGCDTVQGYHIARPLPVDAFTEFIRAAQAGKAIY
jgi:diguanylate cyclase (GGDEF)-like protein/PAS domain S-box-containing protein